LGDVPPYAPCQIVVFEAPINDSADCKGSSLGKQELDGCSRTGLVPQQWANDIAKEVTTIKQLQKAFNSIKTWDQLTI
jgi:predicted HAD superfamily Cof-like phosphohydrolase